MELRSLGSSSLQVSPIAFGCMSLVEGDTYGGISRTQAIATIHAAIDAGITLFDTAPMYGAGRGDEILGEALLGRRDEVVVATKVPPDQLAPEALRRSCHDSLRRLRMESIDLLQIHWPNHEIPLSETWAALQELRHQGLVREIGVCNFGPIDLDVALQLGPCASNQLPYNLLMRAVEYEVQAMCVQHNVGLLCYSPLAQGLLSGKYRTADDVPTSRARTRHFRGDRPRVRHGQAGCEDETFAAINQLAALCGASGLALGDAALAWLLHRPAVASVIVGASHPDQVRRNLDAAGLELPATVSDQFDAITQPLKERLGPCLDLWAPVSRIR